MCVFTIETYTHVIRAYTLYLIIYASKKIMRFVHFKLNVYLYYKIFMQIILEGKNSNRFYSIIVRFYAFIYRCSHDSFAY